MHPLAGPDVVMAFFLLNPFSVMATSAGTTTPFENLCIVAALYAASCPRDLVFSALAVASGAYLGLHPLMLLVGGSHMAASEEGHAPMLWSSMSLQVPITSILVFGPETRQQEPSRVSTLFNNKTRGDDKETATAGLADVSSTGNASSREKLGDVKPHVFPSMDLRRSSWALTAAFLFAATAIAFLGLVAASDTLLAPSFPHDVCLGSLGLWQASGSRQQGWGLKALPSEGCWATQVYGLVLQFGDLTPNIGQWWYFFTEVIHLFERDSSMTADLNLLFADLPTTAGLLLFRRTCALCCICGTGGASLPASGCLAGCLAGTFHVKSN